MANNQISAFRMESTADVLQTLGMFQSACEQVLIISAAGRAFPHPREDMSSRGTGTNSNQCQPPCRLLAGSRCQRPHTFQRATNPSGEESLARRIPRVETLIMFQFKGAESCYGKLKLFIINDPYSK